MTEDMIEIMIEKMFDALDGKFLNSNMTKEEYDSEVLRIKAWGEDKLNQLTVER